MKNPTRIAPNVSPNYRMFGKFRNWAVVRLYRFARALGVKKECLKEDKNNAKNHPYHAFRFPDTDNYIEIYTTDGYVSSTVRMSKYKAKELAKQILSNT